MLKSLDQIDTRLGNQGNQQLNSNITKAAISAERDQAAGPGKELLSVTIADSKDIFLRLCEVAEWLGKRLTFHASGRACEGEARKVLASLPTRSVPPCLTYCMWSQVVSIKCLCLSLSTRVQLLVWFEQVYGRCPS